MSGTPVAEIEVDAALVRGLLAAQHPDLAALPISVMDAGWDNVMFRLGDAFTVRMPRRRVAAALIINEQEWLPRLVGTLPLAVPAPVRIGAPSGSFPWRWSILPWLEGRPASDAPPDAREAPVLAAFLKSLHQLAPDDAPANPFRGCPLADRAEDVAARLAQLTQIIPEIMPQIEATWADALMVPVATENRMLHGDLHARNVLVRDGALSAVIDWGDVTSGDVATDLASIWALFEGRHARLAALQAYGATEAEAMRARGWAINFGTILLSTGLVDDPRHAAMGRDTLRRVADDFA